MARGQRTYAYQSIPDVGPYGTATNRYRDAGPNTGPAIGSLFDSGFIPSVNPTIPAYAGPPASPEAPVVQSELEKCMLSGMSREACEQRAAIAAELAQRANTPQQNLGSGPGNEGYADSGTPGPDTSAPTVAPPVGVPDDTTAPPTTQNTPAPPPAVAPPAVAPPAVVANPPVNPNEVNEIDQAINNPNAPQNQFDKTATDEDIGQTVSPSQAIGPNSSISMANVTPGPVSGFAPNTMNNPTNDPNALTPAMPVEAPKADPVFGLNPPKGYNVDQIMEDMNQGKSVFAPVTPPFSPDPVVDTPTPTPAPPAPPAPQAPTPQAVTQDDVDAAQAIAMANTLGTEDQAVTSVEATTPALSPQAMQAVQADIGTPSQQGLQQGWGVPGISPAMAADIGTAPTSPTGYAAPNSPATQAADALAADLGVTSDQAAQMSMANSGLAVSNDAEANAAVANANAVADAASPSAQGITAAPGLAIGPNSSPADVAQFGDNLAAAIAAENAAAISQAAQDAADDAAADAADGDE